MKYVISIVVISSVASPLTFYSYARIPAHLHLLDSVRILSSLHLSIRRETTEQAMANYTKFVNNADQMAEVNAPSEKESFPTAPPPAYGEGAGGQAVQQPYTGQQSCGQPSSVGSFSPPSVQQAYPSQQGYGQPPAFGTRLPNVYVQQVPAQQTITHVTSPLIPPSDYFGLALFVTLCCCLPLGIVGIVKSSEVKNQAAIGNGPGAQRASREAYRYSMIGLGIGIGCWVIGLILTIVYVVVIINVVNTTEDGFHLADDIDSNYNY